MAHNFRNEVRKLNLITSLRPNGSASGRMAHNFRNEVRKLNLITSLRPNGSASGRMAHILQDFQFDAGNPFFYPKIFADSISICRLAFHLLNSKLPEESQVKLHEILRIMNQNNLSPINFNLGEDSIININT